MSVTLMLIPAAVASAMAVRPAGVAGIFTNRFGRSTARASRCASARVAAASCATAGLTSTETRPSTPPVASNTGERMSHAACTSAVISENTMSVGLAVGIGALISSSWVRYAASVEIAFAKIVGLVVMPTTSRSAMSLLRPPERMRSRERSSSQMLTPAARRSPVVVMTVLPAPLLDVSRRHVAEALPPVLGERTGEPCGPGSCRRGPRSADRHAEVLGLEHHADAVRRELGCQVVGDLHGEPFLELEVAGEVLDDPGQLGEPEESLGRQVADMRDTAEGSRWWAHNDVKGISRTSTRSS